MTEPLPDRPAAAPPAADLTEVDERSAEALIEEHDLGPMLQQGPGHPYTPDGDPDALPHSGQHVQGQSGQGQGGQASTELDPRAPGTAPRAGG